MHYCSSTGKFRWTCRPILFCTSVMLKNLQGNFLDTKVSSTRVVGATPPVALYKFVTSTLDINHNFPIELQIYSLVKWALILRIDGSLKQYINYTCTSCKYMTMIWCVTIDLIVIGCSLNWAYSFYSWSRQHHPRQVYDRHP